MNDKKYCRQCGLEFPTTSEFFYQHKGMKGGLLNTCKKCHIALCRKWQHENADRFVAVDLAYKRAHKEQYRENAKRWRKANPKKRSEIRQRSNRNRRNRKAYVAATLTQGEWESILADYGYQCAYCDKTWLDCKLTQDHVVPLKQGGGYTKENIVPACANCNSRKWARTPEEAGMELRII